MLHPQETVARRNHVADHVAFHYWAEVDIESTETLHPQVSVARWNHVADNVRFHYWAEADIESTERCIHE